MKSNQTLLAESSSQRPTIDASQRHRIRGIVLLLVYLALFVGGGIVVYRIMHLGSLVAQSEPPTQILIDQSLHSNRFALAHGPKEQRLEIIGWLGEQGIRAAPMIDDLRIAANDPDPQIVRAAVIALRQIEDSYARAISQRAVQELKRRPPQR